MFQAKKQPNSRSGAFVSMTVVIFVLSLSAADSIGFVPYYIDGSLPNNQIALADLPELGMEPVVSEPEPVYQAPATQPAPVVAVVKPDRIIIEAIDLNLPVQNPETRDIEKLDTVLQNGPARYVDSAKLGESGNVLIFAHTSHLPVVHNQMYKAFNRIPELVKGDIITVRGEGKEFIYTVKDVRHADAEDEVISLAASLGHILTLVTCDTLTSKSSRWVVEAELVGSY